MATEIEGAAEAIRSLQELESGRFLKNSVRRSLRAGAKVMKAIIYLAIRKRTAVTAEAVSIKAGPRRKNVISMLAGVMGGATRKGIFYAGFADYGHMTKGGKRVQGNLWTEQAKSRTDLVVTAITTVLVEEIESMEWKH